MIWRDIFLSKVIEEKEIIEAFSCILNIDKGKINLIRNILNFRDDDLLTCIIDSLDGDFCMCLDCYVDFNMDNEFEVISSLSMKINCDILITDDTGDNRDNPYAFVIFSPCADPKKVEIDPKLFDEEYKMKIIKN